MNIGISWDFDLRIFYKLALAFILFTVIGTLSHEFGHFLVARFLGFNARIGYAYTSLVGTFDKEIYINNWQIFILGGPMQTLLTSLIGLIILFYNKQKFVSAEKLRFWQWLTVLISLFWLRQTANFAVGLFGYFQRGYFRVSGDESRLSFSFGLPVWTLDFLGGLIGALILAYIIFHIIPQKQRLTFMSAGLVGGISGYILWLFLIGPIILP